MKRDPEKTAAMTTFTALAYRKYPRTSLRKMQSMQQEHFRDRLHHTIIMRIRKRVREEAEQQFMKQSREAEERAAKQNLRDRRMMTALAVFAILIFVGTLAGLLAFCGAA